MKRGQFPIAVLLFHPWDGATGSRKLFFMDSKHVGVGVESPGENNVCPYKSSFCKVWAEHKRD